MRIFGELVGHCDPKKNNAWLLQHPNKYSFIFKSEEGGKENS